MFYKFIMSLFLLFYCLDTGACNRRTIFATERGYSSNIYAMIKEEVEERPTFSLKMRFLNSVLSDFIKANISASHDVEKYIVRYMNTLDANRYQPIDNDDWEQSMDLQSKKIAIPTQNTVMNIVAKSILAKEGIVELINGAKDDRGKFMNILLGEVDSIDNKFARMIAYMTQYDSMRSEMNKRLRDEKAPAPSLIESIKFELMNEEILHRIIDDELIRERIIHKGKNISELDAFTVAFNITEKLKKEKKWKPNIELLERLNERIAVTNYLRQISKELADEREKMIKDKIGGLLGYEIHLEVPVYILIRNELIREREIQRSIKKALCESNE